MRARAGRAVANGAIGCCNSAALRIVPASRKATADKHTVAVRVRHGRFVPWETCSVRIRHGRTRCGELCAHSLDL